MIIDSLFFLIEIFSLRYEQIQKWVMTLKFKEIVSSYPIISQSTSTSIEEQIYLLNNKTHLFMKRFAFRSISLRQPPTEQVNILQAHSTTVAFAITNRYNCQIGHKITEY